MNWINFINTYGIVLPVIFGILEDFLLSKTDKVELYKKTRNVVVMTGGNRGIGIHVLNKLLKCDLTVMLGVRNPEASRKAVESSLGASLTKGKVFYETCDLGDLHSVKKFAKKVRDKFSAIHILINQAGAFSESYKKTQDGFESQMEVNFLGHFLLTHLLVPLLIAGSTENIGLNTRVVTVTSVSYLIGRIPYDDFNYEKYYHPNLAYVNSKLALLMFTKHLQKLFMQNNWKIQSHAIHPGVVNTDIYEGSIVGPYPALRKLLFKTPERGSRTIVYGAISPDIEGNGGTYLSNCRVSSTYGIVNDEFECDKFFNFTLDLLKIEHFGYPTNASIKTIENF